MRRRNDMFTQQERSTFAYWFAHWCAYQMTALNHRAWKPRYLLHDIEKPWLRLILRDYERVREIHRAHSSHHIQYRRGVRKIDYDALALDYEASRFTKAASSGTVRAALIKDICHMRIEGFSEDDIAYFGTHANMATQRVLGIDLDKKQ